VLRDPRSLEVRVSFEGFGSGFSLVIYSKHLPADDLKIDKSFIDGLGKIR
jgi:sensor c-di-GMP phosphodiesterase-like protein